MKRLLVLALAAGSFAFAQHGKAVRAGSVPKVRPAPARVTVRPKLAARVQPLLPPGVTVDVAAEGFKNTGQFIAALHVSKNLGIPFDALKAEMTGPEPKSLGRAIQTLKPDLPEGEVDRISAEAKRQAKADQREGRP
jgi:hypothetical protein